MLKKKSSLRHTGAFWAFVAPCCILFGIFFLLPLVLSIAFSFTNYDGWKVMDFVGIKNYITLFKDSKFYASMGRTLVYTICCLPFRVIIPLLIAVLVTSPRVRLKSLSRTMIYIPVLMSALVVGITINWMFSQEYGLTSSSSPSAAPRWNGRSTPGLPRSSSASPPCGPPSASI